MFAATAGNRFAAEVTEERNPETNHGPASAASGRRQASFHGVPKGRNWTELYLEFAWNNSRIYLLKTVALDKVEACGTSCGVDAGGRYTARL